MERNARTDIFFSEEQHYRSHYFPQITQQMEPIFLPTTPCCNHNSHRFWHENILNKKRQPIHQFSHAWSVLQKLCIVLFCQVQNLEERCRTKFSSFFIPPTKMSYTIPHYYPKYEIGGQSLYSLQYAQLPKGCLSFFLLQVSLNVIEKLCVGGMLDNCRCGFAVKTSNLCFCGLVLC